LLGYVRLLKPLKRKEKKRKEKKRKEKKRKEKKRKEKKRKEKKREEKRKLLFKICRMNGCLTSCQLCLEANACGNC
jgi:hypothetical protein